MKPTALAVLVAALTFAAAPAFAACSGHSKNQSVQAPTSSQGVGTSADTRAPAPPRG